MSGVTISIDVEGYKPLSEKLGGILRRIGHMRPLMETIGSYLTYTVRRRFALGIGPDGKRWPDSLRVIEHGGQTEIESGRLRDSYQDHASDTSVEEGSNAIYAGIQHFGGKIVPVHAKALHFRIGGRDVFAQSVTIPARPALGLNEDDISEIGQIVDEYIMGDAA